MPDHEYSAFGVRICKNSHKEIRRIRRDSGAPAIHGNKLWRASFLLMDYLEESGLEPGMRVLELGCGYGLAGVYCAKKYGAEVVALDADAAVLPYAELHAELNGVEISTWNTRYEKLRAVDFEDFDLVLGADICFWDQMSQLLYNLIRRAQRNGPTSVLMADPGRPPFREMAERAEAKLGAEYFDWYVNHPWNASGVMLAL
ncbi:class I SAM-dependent methyltransferase [Agaribacterium haliotis]|uniref:class I SAM-dependent methyltransferase n=1 Tax=Agaribacterium haliotis TaxID=2013869 RepID=UPI000BB57AF4|nr:methyltransferase domain-containing protein [Agaribacterium haliotis]